MVDRAPGLILLILLIVLASVAFNSPVHRWGDTSTYYLQITSISEDHDIEYRAEDLQRALEKKIDDLPAGLFMIKTDEGRYFYGKEYSYALLAAPFYIIFDNSGILLLNALLLWLMILMGYLYLKKNNSKLVALGISSSFFLISTAFVYLFWVHVEIYNMFLITAGLFSWFEYRENKNFRFLFLASLIFGIATVAKLPNCLIFVPIAFYEMYTSKNTKIILMLLLFLIPIIVFYGIFFINTGEITFYGGNRLFFLDKFPYHRGYDSINEAGYPGFSVTDGRTSALIQDFENLKVIPYNIVYYIFGKFTGMVWYYPFSIFALFSLLSGLLISKLKSQKKGYLLDHIKDNIYKYIVFTGIFLNVAFFIIIIGNNYLGGAHAVGNRYFYIYPAFLFLIGFVDWRKFIIFLIASALVLNPVISNPIETSYHPGVHTTKMPYAFLPVEYTQMNNLPSWGIGHKLPGLFILRMDDNSLYIDGGFLSNGSAEYLIRTSNEIQNLNLIVQSSKINQNIFLKIGHKGKPFLLNDTLSTINVSDFCPNYSDKNYALYLLKVQSNNEIWLLPILNESLTPLKLNYLDGFHGIENWKGISSRWISNNATLLVWNNHCQDATLAFRAHSFSKSRTIELYCNDVLVTKGNVNTGYINMTSKIKLCEGVNIIRLYVREGCDCPCDIPELNNKDSRCLSIALQNIQITKFNSTIHIKITKNIMN
ncbi:hypothetical protein [Methanocalculus sp.]|uniref:hypothetical protein n=1 Tax=Methanocalculus sp. TaxID=2004547 RepID=UPI00262FA752|nr:hypothetical protein [Methanocalculus sp.]